MRENTASIILVVEDNRQARAMFQEFLKNQGYGVLTASTGEEALIKLMENEVDLVVLDYQLPDVNGLHVLQSIRKKNTLLPVIIVTAHDDEQVARQALADGATLLLSKPVQIGEFLACVQNAIEPYIHRQPPPLG